MMNNLKKIFLITIFLKNSPLSCMMGVFPFKKSYKNYFEEHYNKPIDKLDLELIKSIDNYSRENKNENLIKIKNLIKNRANINIQDKEGNNLLNLACYIADINIVTILINSKIDINKQNSYGNTPFILAFKNSNIENLSIIIKILIRAGADYWIKNSYDKSFAYYVELSSFDYVKKIIIAKDGICSEIYKAIDKDDIKEVKNLLLKGYKYFYTIKQNNMLHIAAIKNKPTIFILIFKSSPELIYEENRMGQTPIDANPSMLVHLINHKINIDKLILIKNSKRKTNYMAGI